MCCFCWSISIFLCSGNNSQLMGWLFSAIVHHGILQVGRHIIHICPIPLSRESQPWPWWWKTEDSFSWFIPGVSNTLKKFDQNFLLSRPLDLSLFCPSAAFVFKYFFNFLSYPFYVDKLIYLSCLRKPESVPEKLIGKNLMIYLDWGNAKIFRNHGGRSGIQVL